MWAVKGLIERQKMLQGLRIGEDSDKRTEGSTFGSSWDKKQVRK